LNSTVSASGENEALQPIGQQVRLALNQ